MLSMKEDINVPIILILAEILHINNLENTKICQKMNMIRPNIDS